MIFCDMDGVLVDFNKGFFELTGVAAKVADSNGVFVDLFFDSLKKKEILEKDFWAKLDWTEDGKELWDYIHVHNPSILTAPMYNPEHCVENRYCINHNQCMQGKVMWIDRLKNVKDLHFKPSHDKSELANEGLILIDDREDIIKSWSDRGGIGIHHTSTINSIKKLERFLK